MNWGLVSMELDAKAAYMRSEADKLGGDHRAASLMAAAVVVVALSEAIRSGVTNEPKDSV